jgi:hypothetical protein
VNSISEDNLFVDNKEMKEMVHIYYDEFGNRTKNKKKAKFEYIEYSTEF